MKHTDVELWATIPSAPDYQASSLGRIRRRTQPNSNNSKIHMVRKLLEGRGGYLYVSLVMPDGTQKNSIVHRLVLEAFCGAAPPDRPLCAHGDGDRKNNRIENLRWASHSENARDRILHGTQGCGYSTKLCKIDGAQADAIRKLADSGVDVRLISRAVGISVGQTRKVLSEGVLAL